MLARSYCRRVSDRCHLQKHTFIECWIFKLPVVSTMSQLQKATQIKLQVGDKVVLSGFLYHLESDTTIIFQTSGSVIINLIQLFTALRTAKQTICVT